ncbi:ribose 5-phosphate isomerase B [Campylobacter canadensis]|uniref:Ribose 5-phosphate isomerase B n=1 Tax=Campylobacter canadensis TaxID=449520 RepID=A0ABS7WQQ1_9BACT|nr:ribose 5-phosphate isomerase B [Campylobacter canadensis]MBZ7987085.1 ribose 5-phosphate isomerase B [Campylobacter canadensis]MBZ7994699.1 ribose 5-phosphate isomerase B [Campylobacter canadensis]MBZ7996195.1 ribose 5-phosphate isomerase B [Campylobacter canadensis]MBZ7998121.1 ribose 5-phosphate isomerase B [Campylobacter canadensis]MBZ7999989.1 ribose 5-phosphate isomerase B [Campylobacter canadensis]
MRLLFANDHAASELKMQLIEYFQKDYECINYGTNDNNSVDYPDYAQKVCENMDENSIGILLCGSGIGMSIAANKHKGIRAALCHCVEYAKLAREHNNANILCIGARFCDFELAKDMIKTFLNTTFAANRHTIRVEKLDKL